MRRGAISVTLLPQEAREKAVSITKAILQSFIVFISRYVYSL